MIKRRLRNLVEHTAERLGVALFVRRKPRSASYPHACYVPEATYSPWRADAEFQDVYQHIRPNTLVDIYRCYELWQLVEQSVKLRGAIIEVGAWRGGTSALIGAHARRLGILDTVYVCDTFTGLANVGPNDSGYVNGMYAAPRADTEELHRSMGLTDMRIVEGVFPQSAAFAEAEGVSFRLAHIDVDVYESAAQSVAWIWPRLAPGGLMVFDDFGDVGPAGVTRFVNEQWMLPDRIAVHNLNGHAVFIKL